MTARPCLSSMVSHPRQQLSRWNSRQNLANPSLWRFRDPHISRKKSLPRLFVSQCELLWSVKFAFFRPGSVFPRTRCIDLREHSGRGLHTCTTFMSLFQKFRGDAQAHEGRLIGDFRAISRPWLYSTDSIALSVVCLAFRWVGGCLLTHLVDRVAFRASERDGWSACLLACHLTGNSHVY